MHSRVGHGAVGKTSLSKSRGYGFKLTGNICFFSVGVTKLPSMVLAANIFSKTIRILEYGLSKHIFFKLSDYRNIKYWAGKLGKLSDYQISDTKLKLSDIGSKKNYQLPSSGSTSPGC
jgi:hypothetical protein